MLKSLTALDHFEATLNAQHKQLTKYHHGDLRETLLDAVRELIERDGADAFKVAEACRIAGVSTAAPYKQFKDRDDIVRTVASQGMSRLFERMASEAARFRIGDQRRIEALGHAYLEFAEAEPGIFRLMVSLSDQQADDAALQHKSEKLNELVNGVVADHLERSSDAEDVRLRAYALWCFVHGHAFLRIDNKLAAKEPPVPAPLLLAVIGDAMLQA